MVNPGAFQLCARCGARMDTHLQESSGLRRTAPVQSPVPVARRLGPLQRVLLGAFVLIQAMTYFVHLLPSERGEGRTTPAPAAPGEG